MFQVQRNGKKKKRIVQQVSRSRCKERISIFKTTMDFLTKKMFQFEFFEKIRILALASATRCKNMEKKENELKVEASHFEIRPDRCTIFLCRVQFITVIGTVVLLAVRREIFISSLKIANFEGIDVEYGQKWKDSSINGTYVCTSGRERLWDEIGQTWNVNAVEYMNLPSGMRRVNSRAAPFAVQIVDR